MVVSFLPSVPANTAIYQSAVAFTFILSVPILREKISVVKVTIFNYPQHIFKAAVLP